MSDHSTPRVLPVPGRAEVDHLLWSQPGSLPVTHAMVTWTPESLSCRIVVLESEPTATFSQPNDPVHKDSCVEWFLAPWPGTGLYLNLEANAVGTLYAAFGTKAERHLLSPELRTMVAARADLGDEQWSITYTVTTDLLDALADLASRPRVELRSGTDFEANFYKCGEHTPVRHYGAWSPVPTEQPDFHRPDHFGRLVLT